MPTGARPIPQPVSHMWETKGPAVWPVVFDTFGKGGSRVINACLYQCFCHPLSAFLHFRLAQTKGPPVWPVVFDTFRNPFLTCGKLRVPRFDQRSLKHCGGKERISRLQAYPYVFATLCRHFCIFGLPKLRVLQFGPWFLIHSATRFPHVGH